LNFVNILAKDDFSAPLDSEPAPYVSVSKDVFRLLKKADKKGVIRGNPDRTKDLILDAALAEFAENGLGGARIEVIAKKAHVNKQALYYHFDSKDGLYKATIEYGYKLVRSFDSPANDEALSPPERLSNIISGYFDNINEHQAVVSLVAEENRLRGKHLSNSKFVTDINAPFVERVRTVYEDGVAQGRFRADVDPHQLWITIVSVSQFPFSNAYTISHILKTDIKTRAMLAIRKKHVVDFVLSALRP
jgi:TetR/AcrR family transcriptional regulator